MKNNGKKLLICEDDKDIAEVVSIYLTLQKINHEIVEFGNDVVPRVEDDHVDLVLMDLTLPDTNGMEVAREIKKLRKEVPVIYFSASSKIDAAMKKVPVDGMLRKPFDFSDLADLLKQYGF